MPVSAPISKSTREPEPRIALDPVAKAQAPVLRNLYQLYAHDFTEHVPFAISQTGLFDVAPSEEWWTREGHAPFFIRSSEELAGFALVRRGSRVTADPEVMDVAEFFVLRGMRKKGVGVTAAHALFAAFPGRWEIRVRVTNVSAMVFWSRVVEGWTRRPAVPSPFSAGGIDWQLYCIER